MTTKSFPIKFLCGLFTITLLISLTGVGFASTIDCEGDDPPIVDMSSVKLPNYEVTGPSGEFYDYRSIRSYSVMEPVDVFEIPVEAEGCTEPGGHTKTGKVTVKFSAKELLLESPNDPHAAHMAMWDDPYQRISDRAMPWVEIRNDVDSDSTVTQFMMTIGDLDFHFSNELYDDYILESTMNTEGIDLSVVATDLTPDGDPQKLTININGGLAPGEVARFRVKLAPNDPDAFQFPDYRLTFFNMNDLFETDDPAGINNTVVSVEQEICACPPIPEPGTLALLMITCVGFGSVVWRKSRSAA